MTPRRSVCTVDGSSSVTVPRISRQPEVQGIVYLCAAASGDWWDNTGLTRFPEHVFGWGDAHITTTVKRSDVRSTVCRAA